MLTLLLAWATVGLATLPGSEPSVKRGASSATREWTDASGSRHVRAVLLRVEGDKLWLRRSDGKLATTKISQLSAADQQYVRTNPPTKPADSAAESTPSGLAAEVVDKIGEKVQSVVKLPGWTNAS